MMKQEIIFSGIGGQGIMLMGQILTQAGLEEGKQVSWIPSYGPEMRGGTAYCSVVISDERIGSPIVVEPTILVVMNLPSLHRFQKDLLPKGTLIINESLAPERSSRKDIQQFVLPMNELADQVGDKKALNFIALGALLAATGVVDPKALQAAVLKMFGKKFAEKPELMEVNQRAFQVGYEAALKQKGI